jgi:hypothetical protein
MEHPMICDACKKESPRLINESLCRACNLRLSRKGTTDYARFGSPIGGITVERRFFDKVKKTDNCWIWTASVNKQGYGALSIGKKQIRAHRVSYMLFKGQIPDGMHVCHSCDNPSCVNPDHLWIGTPKDNAKDCLMKNRFPIGQRAGRAKLTEHEVIMIRRATIVGKAIAKKYNISLEQVYNIRQRRSWKHV